MKQPKVEIGLLIIIISIVQVISCFPKIYEGDKTVLDLPLIERGNQEKMYFTYWTGNVETRECMRSAVSCEFENMDQYLFGILTLTNVNTEKWEDSVDTLDLRLAFNRFGTDYVYDIFLFEYLWNKKMYPVTGYRGWSCKDAHIANEKGVSPSLFWKSGTFNSDQNEGEENTYLDDV